MAGQNEARLAASLARLHERTVALDPAACGLGLGLSDEKVGFTRRQDAKEPSGMGAGGLTGACDALLALAGLLLGDLEVRGGKLGGSQLSLLRGLDLCLLLLDAALDGVIVGDGQDLDLVVAQDAHLLEDDGSVACVEDPVVGVLPAALRREGLAPASLERVDERLAVAARAAVDLDHIATVLPVLEEDRDGEAVGDAALVGQKPVEPPEGVLHDVLGVRLHAVVHAVVATQVVETQEKLRVRRLFGRVDAVDLVEAAHDGIGAVRACADRSGNCGNRAGRKDG